MLPDEMFNKRIFRAVLSKPVKGSEADFVRVEVVRNGTKYQASKYTAKQVFHENFNAAGVRGFLDGLFGASFLHYTAWDGEFEYSARVTKKGKVRAGRRAVAGRPADSLAGDSFNRVKNHIIREGEAVPALVDMGVFTKGLKVAAPMWDKFAQINRFLEILDDETRKLPRETVVNIIDFGCGKSYLTFLVYYFFTEKRGLRANIRGLDLDAEIVEKCTAAAKKYGYATLEFMRGDIAALDAPLIEGWGAAGTFNIVISLHACDTATDHALFNALRWRADLICAAPCCQHELRGQMAPRTLTLFADYGIIKERVAALATDALRAKILENCGYRTQIIEFAALEHTQKNLLIRARKIKSVPFKESEEIRAVLNEFGFEPMLLKLIIKAIEVGK